jgi:hypothetical protein
LSREAWVSQVFPWLRLQVELGLGEHLKQPRTVTQFVQFVQAVEATEAYMST